MLVRLGARVASCAAPTGQRVAITPSLQSLHWLASRAGVCRGSSASSGGEGGAEASRFGAAISYRIRPVPPPHPSRQYMDDGQGRTNNDYKDVRLCYVSDNKRGWLAFWTDF